MPEPRPIGLIGLGDLGLVLARRLAAEGARAVAYDIDSVRRREFSVPGLQAEIAGSLTDLGHDCDIVLSALPDVASLRQAAVGDEDRLGFALAMRPGSIIVHFGGGPYREVLRLTGQLGSAGIGLIDVMTCAEPCDADSGRMEMLVGGYPDLVEQARGVLEAIGPFSRIGATGTATGLAALRGYVRAARLIALSEALLIGRHAGIGPELLSRVFDGPIAVGPQCRSIAGEARAVAHSLDLETTTRAVADAVAFSERIGVSGECVAFARDMLSDAIAASSGGDESMLLRHFAAIASADP